MKSLRDLDRLLDAMNVAIRDIVVHRRLEQSWSVAAAPAGAVTFLTVIDGQALITVQGRPASLCMAGTTMLIPPKMPVTIVPLEGCPFVAGGVATVSLSENFGLLDRAKVPIVESIVASPLAVAARDRLIAEAGRKGPRLGGQALANSLMKALVLSVLERLFDRPGIDQKVIGALADPSLAGPVAMILDDVAGAHSLTKLAARAGLSNSTFARQFQAALGMSPMEFVTRARLHRAAQLLRLGATPVKTVAALVGFSSRSHFSKAFRDLYGRDPTLYREQEGPCEELARPLIHHVPI